MPRKKKCPRTNKENPDRQGVMPRTTLSSADQDHERRRCHATKGSLLERPNGKPERHRPAIGAWWRSDPRKGRHLHIKYPQLTSLPHCRRRDPWTVLSRSQQLTEYQKEQLMGRALKCGQGWLTGVGSGWIEKKPYKVKDLLRGKGEGASGRGGGEGDPGSSFMPLVNRTRWEFIPLGEELVPSDCESVHPCVFNSYSTISTFHASRCLIKAQLLDSLSTNSL